MDQRRNIIILDPQEYFHLLREVEIAEFKYKKRLSRLKFAHVKMGLSWINQVKNIILQEPGAVLPSEVNQMENVMVPITFVNIKE